MPEIHITADISVQSVLEILRDIWKLPDPERSKIVQCQGPMSYTTT